MLPMSKTAKNRRQKNRIESQGIAIKEAIKLGESAIAEMKQCDVDYTNMLTHRYTPPILRNQAE